MTQPQTQPAKAEPKQPKHPLDGFTPDESTLWLVQQHQSLETPTQLALQDRYDGRVIGRIVNQIDPRRLSERHTIVPVFVDYREPVRDEKTGKLRPRRNRGEERDPIVVKFGRPVSCRDLVLKDDDTGDMNVQTANLTGEDGRIRKGLVALGTDACSRVNARGKTEAVMKFRYRSDDHVLTLTDL